MKKKSLISVFVIFVFMISLVAVNANYQPEKFTMPDDVKVAVDKSCFGCHNTASKNDDAKEELDFKKMDHLSRIRLISTYKEIGETIEKGEMPPKRFLEKYPDKKLTDEEKELLINWSKKEAEALVKGQ